MFLLYAEDLQWKAMNCFSEQKERTSRKKCVSKSVYTLLIAHNLTAMLTFNFFTPSLMHIQGVTLFITKLIETRST